MKEELRFRQIHLDFHTSPLIPEVGEDFDPSEFVETLRKAHVNSINVFAKCHHGLSYYPTKVGIPHPHLRRDLLGEMMEACRRADIRTPVYVSVIWDEAMADAHPDWRQIDADGKFIGPPPHKRPHWRCLCLNSPLADYIAERGWLRMLVRTLLLPVIGLISLVV